MKPPDPKGQHYVQRAYLAGFQDPTLKRIREPLIWVYMQDKPPFRQNVEKVAKQYHYYCYEDGGKKRYEAETFIQRLEDASMPVLHQLRAQEFSLTTDAREHFAAYVALSFVRVPTFERSVDRLANLVQALRLQAVIQDEPALRAVVRRLNEESGEDTTLEDFRTKLTGGNVRLAQVNRGWSIAQMFQLIPNFQQVILQMRWTFLVAASDDDGFLTSDNPVSLFDPTKAHGGVGFASSRDAYFTFPISRRVCLVAGHLPRPRVVELDRMGVRHTNVGTMIRADQQLYAPFKSAAVRAKFNKVMAHRRTPKAVLVRHGVVVEE